MMSLLTALPDSAIAKYYQFISPDNTHNVWRSIIFSMLRDGKPNFNKLIKVLFPVIYGGMGIPARGLCAPGI